MEDKELQELEEFTLEDIIREFSDHPFEEPAQEEVTEEQETAAGEEVSEETAPEGETDEQVEEPVETLAEEAVEEAEFMLDQVKHWDIQMPLVFDWEYSGEGIRTSNVDSRTLTDMAKAFCETIRDAGYEPMIYFGRSQSMNMMKLEELTDYPFWLAMYSTVMDYPYKINMWQYTDTGSVPGIEGNVDLNLLFTYK